MRTTRSLLIRAIIALTLLTLTSDVTAQVEPERPTDATDASGTFAPSGPPVGTERIDAGSECIVDLEQAYDVQGTLSGLFQIDYRIWVDGPCGSPPGTFDESWIAHGRFIGQIDGVETAATLSYLADVANGGQINGWIRLGPTLSAELRIRGSFSGGRVEYRGWTETPTPSPSPRTP